MDKWNDMAQRLFANETEFKQAWEQYNNLQAFEHDTKPILERENALNEPEHIKQLLIDEAVIEYQEQNINLQLLEQFKKYNEAKERDGLTYDKVSSQYASETRKKDSIQLNNAIEGYYQYRIDKKGVNEKNANKEIYYLNLMLKIINENPDRETPAVMSSDLTNKDIEYYGDIVHRMPVNVIEGKRTKGKTIAEILSLKLSPMAPKTHSYHIDTVKWFVGWIKTKNCDIDYEYINNSLELIPTSKEAKKVRKPFSNEQLKMIFESDNYVSEKRKNNRTYQCGNKFKYAIDYWQPLIALFTGARKTEIFQAHIEDIYYDNDIKTWVFRIDKLDISHPEYHVRNDKTLKNKPSKRTIPIHSKLITLGLIKYRDYVASTGEYKLFPNDDRSDPGANFKTFINGIGVVPEKDHFMIGMHSFRHGFRTLLFDLKTVDGVDDDILGHDSKNRSKMHDTYVHSDGLAPKVKLMKKVLYDFIDFDKICRWEKCLFHRKQFRQGLK